MHQPRPAASPAVTPADTPADRPRRRRRPGRVIVDSVMALIGVGALTIGVTAAYDGIATAAERDDVRSYGQRVRVDSGEVNVVVRGSGGRTVVLLPGFGTSAPAIDFAPLVDRLAPGHRVVVVEPLGYGLSDQTDRARTSANIVDEVHTALASLDIDRYVLMGHSVAGVYALEYVAAHRSEVEAFVGIDSSVPTQPGIDDAGGLGLLRALKATGLTRVITGAIGGPYAGLPYTSDQKEQMRLLSNRNSLSATYLDEYEHLAPNFRSARRLRFPADLPVLLFVQQDNGDVAGWERLHREQAASVHRGEVVLLDGEHYLHHTHAARIAADTEAFLAEDS